MLAVALFDLWVARTSHGGFYWKYDLGGYYNYLSRGFLQGHLYTALEPAPELLALSDPWDPKVESPAKVMDMVLYNRHYYLYHGAGPAVMLFVPWRLVVRHDLDEPFAAFLFCLGGLLFYSGALLRILRLAGARVPLPLLALMLLALGLCPCVPYLLNRVYVYEVAICSGYCTLGGAIYFLVRAIGSRRRTAWLAASGLMFGVAISCRPHLGLAGVTVLAAMALARTRWREMAAWLAPFCLAGLAIATYNYERFGDPFEFGMRYELAGESYRNPKPAAANVGPGLYYMLGCAPDFSPVFPWIRQVFRLPLGVKDYDFPKRYFLEPAIGALYLAPFLAGLLLLPWAGRAAPAVRPLLWTLAAAAVLILFFITTIGLSAQRFEADFLPAASLAATAAVGIGISKDRGWRRASLACAFAGCALFGSVAGLALGVTGPYDDLLKNRTRTYLRVAGWFSPIERLRPRLNPRVTAEFRAEFPPLPPGVREPLVSMGQRTWRYLLYAEQAGEKIRIGSYGAGSEVAYEMDPQPGRAIPFHVRCAGGRVSVAVDGREVIVQQVTALLTAPAQVAIGGDRIYNDYDAQSVRPLIRVSRTAVSVH